jgi:cytochrome c-type biogenesis protein CcsB
MNPEFIFFWIAVVLYGVSSLVFIMGLLLKSDKTLTLGTLGVLAGFLPHGVSVALRWIQGGVLPFIEVSESITSGVFIAVFIFLMVQAFTRKLRALGVLVMPVCFVLLGWAGTLMKEIGGQLPASLQSYWLWVHIIVASAGFGSVLIASGMGLLYLLKEKNSGGMYEKFPELTSLDNLGYRFIACGFIMLGLMIVSGIFWSNQVKGSYWNWDPVEVWSLISWLVYGIYLHLRITLGWRGRRLSWYALLALAVMIISYWGIPFVAQNFHTGFRIEH